MSADSEIAQTFNAMKEHNKKVKSARLEAADESGWEKHTPYHWWRLIDGNKLDYWPSTGKCKYKGKMTHINSNKIKRILEASQ